MAGICYDLEHPERGDIDLERRELRVTGKGRKERMVKFGYTAARAVDRYLRLRGKHAHRLLGLAVPERCGEQKPASGS